MKRSFDAAVNQGSPRRLIVRRQTLFQCRKLPSGCVHQLFDGVPELLTQPRAEYSNYVTGGLDQGFLRDLDVLLNALIDRVLQPVS